MDKLFEDSAKGQESRAAAGRVVGVVVNANLWRTFDYLWPDALGEPAAGQRVRVPFGKGNRTTLAFVVETTRPAGERKLKAVAEVLDPQPQLDEELLELARWISRYYLTPLGMVLAAMIPSAVGRHAQKSESVVFLAAERKDWPSSLGGRQKQALDELLEARKQGIEPLPLESLLRHSQVSRESLKRLTARNLIRLETRPVVVPELAEGSEGDPFDLNEEQKAALEALEAKLPGPGANEMKSTAAPGFAEATPGKHSAATAPTPATGKFSVTLLYGVTGSGKTEVYVRAIRRVIAAGRQAILLVPEIALATQTLQRLLKRLPRVAVLHSGLTSAQRAFYYEQIRDGHAAVVVGPRSAVFAPARKLGLIVVDEEHEPSYKQDTAPRYHARDVAVKRASIAGVPVLLGSATPSLESYHNVAQKRYDLLRLGHRVRGLPMPRLEIVHLRKELQPGKIELIGSTLTRRIAAALDRREQIILLMNRRGYASYVFCPSCRWIFTCDNCSRPMVFHQATQLAMCHHCDRRGPLPEYCPACRGKLLLFGFGIQRIEGELSRKFPTARVARMDSDTMTSAGQFHRVFEQFSSGELDILLGTQMVAKGLDFPRVSVVGVVSADTSLAIPDFRAAERTFQLIVQVAGRAGRADLPGEVVVQTLHPEEPSILLASQHDYDGFAAGELPSRKETHLPPFSRLVRFVIRHEDVEKARQAAETFASRLRPLLPADAVAIGPQIAGVPKIRNEYRFQLLVSCPRAGVVQQAVGENMEALCRDLPAELAADVDPVNLL